jgi:hypothetical protein
MIRAGLPGFLVVLSAKFLVATSTCAAVFVLVPAASASVIVNPGDTTFCGVYDLRTTKKPITVPDGGFLIP